MTTKAPGVFVVGLTGGIGSGKSAAAELFRECGAAIIDADAIAHEVTAPDGAAIPALEAEFGPEILTTDRALDRAAMRKLAFSDPEARRRLERIVHPLVRATSDARCRAAGATAAPYVVLVVPLLVESGNYRERVSRLAVVDCPEEMQIARVMARSGMTRAEVERIMAVQATREQRLAAADDVIDNGGSLLELVSQIRDLHSRYIEMARIG